MASPRARPMLRRYLLTLALTGARRALPETLCAPMFGSAALALLAAARADVHTGAGASREDDETAGPTSQPSRRRKHYHHVASGTTARRILLAAHAMVLATSGACAAQPRAEPAVGQVGEQPEARPRDAEHDASPRRGAGNEVTFVQFRAAVEHYQVGVRRDAVSALGNAADAYAAYLRAFHTHLHIEYVHHFLTTLSRLDSETNDPSLSTKVEVVIEPDGTLNRLGVVRSSGSVRFDFGVFNAVHRGAPYPPPPKAIQSPDGRTYLRWALHRDQSQCGTWNAEPFILKYVMVPESAAP